MIALNGTAKRRQDKGLDDCDVQELGWSLQLSDVGCLILSLQAPFRAPSTQASRVQNASRATDNAGAAPARKTRMEHSELPRLKIRRRGLVEGLGRYRELSRAQEESGPLKRTAKRCHGQVSGHDASVSVSIGRNHDGSGAHGTSTSVIPGPAKPSHAGKSREWSSTMSTKRRRRKRGATCLELRRVGTRGTRSTCSSLTFSGMALPEKDGTHARRREQRMTRGSPHVPAQRRQAIECTRIRGRRLSLLSSWRTPSASSRRHTQPGESASGRSWDREGRLECAGAAPALLT